MGYVLLFSCIGAAKLGKGNFSSGDLQALELRVVYSERRSEMAHGRIYGTIVCLHYEARSQSMAMLMRCI